MQADHVVQATLTIEQLAARSGMSVRNIRAHQARGLISPPEVRRRVGYYGPEHVAQLELVRDLQREGFNLAGIKRLLDDRRGTAERLGHFRQALAAADGQHAEVLTAAELGRRFRVDPEHAPRVLERAQRLGVLAPTEDGRFQAPSASLLQVAEQVVDRGVSLDGALAVFEQIERNCDAVSAAFVSLFMREVWEPFQAQGMPVARWREIEESIEQLRPLATEALVAIFGQRMSAQIDAVFGQLTQRLSEPGDPGSDA
ncbi:MAG: MerR family transcriptional regulator [Solirubrobacteraceae bacterium]